jgi:hypothetical protein
MRDNSPLVAAIQYLVLGSASSGLLFQAVNAIGEAHPGCPNLADGIGAVLGREYLVSCKLHLRNLERELHGCFWAAGPGLHCSRPLEPVHVTGAYHPFEVIA